jgi:hypothetical protein
MQPQSSTDLVDPTPAPTTRIPATTRPSTSRHDDHKRLHRQAIRRPLPQDTHVDPKRPLRRGITRPSFTDQLPPSKRNRPMLHRAAKRHLTTHVPSSDIQKRARIEAIITTARFLRQS